MTFQENERCGPSPERAHSHDLLRAVWRPPEARLTARVRDSPSSLPRFPALALRQDGLSFAARPPCPGPGLSTAAVFPQGFSWSVVVWFRLYSRLLLPPPPTSGFPMSCGESDLSPRGGQKAPGAQRALSESPWKRTNEREDGRRSAPAPGSPARRTDRAAGSFGAGTRERGAGGGGRLSGRTAAAAWRAGG